MELLADILMLVSVVLVWFSFWVNKKYQEELRRNIDIERQFGEIAMSLNKQLLEIIDETIENYENSRYYDTEDVLKDILLTTNTKKEENAVRETIRLVKEKQEVKG